MVIACDCQKHPRELIRGNHLIFEFMKIYIRRLKDLNKHDIIVVFLHTAPLIQIADQCMHATETLPLGKRVNVWIFFTGWVGVTSKSTSL